MTLFRESSVGWKEQEGSDVLSEVCLSAKLADPITLIEALWGFITLYPLDLHECAHFFIHISSNDFFYLNSLLTFLSSSEPTH